MSKSPPTSDENAIRDPSGDQAGCRWFAVTTHRCSRPVIRSRITIADSPCAIEINGDPHRLDLDPARARAARARGAKFVLSTDAHSTAQLDYIANAVAMARRARIRRGDVLNTLPPDEFARAVSPSLAGRARS